jgi:hypothetical protein
LKLQEKLKQKKPSSHADDGEDKEEHAKPKSTAQKSTRTNPNPKRKPDSLEEIIQL